jgi:hypothetical protein
MSGPLAEAEAVSFGADGDIVLIRLLEMENGRTI